LRPAPWAGTASGLAPWRPPGWRCSMAKLESAESLESK
jgi:hypothetical protein